MKLLLALLFSCVFIVAFVFLRGPHVSNFLKMKVLTEIQEATGRQVIAQKMILNLFPFFIEARDVKSYDEDGVRLFSAERVKAYISLRDLLGRRVVISRVVLVKPEVWADRDRLKRVAEDIERGGAGVGADGGGLPVKISAITVKDGAVSFRDEDLDALITAVGVDAEALLRDKPEFMFSVAGLSASVGSFPELSGSVSGSMVIDGKTVNIRSLEAVSLGSSVRAEGTYLGDLKGEFTLDANLQVDSLRQLMDLKGNPEGSIHAKGGVKLEGDLANPVLDLELAGSMHLETLLEAARANPSARLTGFARFKGGAEGPVNDIVASGSAWMEGGSFYGVEVGKTRCAVHYSGGSLDFKEGDAELYGGRGKAEVSISLPHVDTYTVKVAFTDADSGPALGLIGLSALGLPRGRVSGDFFTSGSEFQPMGKVSYTASEAGEGPIGRIKLVSGAYHSEGDAIVLTGFRASTSNSKVDFSGMIDTVTDRLDFGGNIITEDINDLLDPYFKKAGGKGRLKASVSGTVEEPTVKVSVESPAAYLDDLDLGELEGFFSYEKKAFKLVSATARSDNRALHAKGEVLFPEADKFLDLDAPRFNLEASAENFDLNALLGLLGLDLPLAGSFGSSVRIVGPGPDPSISGSAVVKDALVYGRSVSEARFDYKYESKRFSFLKAKLKEGESLVSLEGYADGDGYGIRASSDSLMLDALLTEPLPLNFKMSLSLEGEGTYDNPKLKVSALLSDGRLKGARFGGGRVEAVLSGSEVSWSASLVEDRLDVNGGVTLEGDFPWRADVKIGQGRYGFLVAPFLKEVPGDLLLGLSGRVGMSGDKSHFRASAVLDNLNINLYGQGFSNIKEVRIDVEDRSLNFSDVRMRGGNTYLSVDGSVVVGSSYNILVEGSSSLAPLGALHNRIETLRGEAEFVMALRGPWDSPKINGGVSVKQGFFSLKDVPQRFSSISGYVYIDEDEAVVQSLKAKVGGGDIEVSGIVQLAGLKINKVYLDILTKNVTLTLAKGFVASIDGNIVAKGSYESLDLAGELKIIRASYKERIEWKTWLLEARKKKVARAKSGFGDRVNLNIKVTGDQGILLDNNIARTRLKVDLIIRGTVNSPRLFGRIESREGKVFFRNSEFRIISATADYADTSYNNPFIGIHAETSIKGYRILLNLDGKIEQLDLALASDPPLEDVQILALLAFGEFGGNLSGLESGIGAAEATSFITGKFQDVIEERFTDITGFDRFQIDPYVSSSTGSVTPKVTVSKRLMSEKLFVTYGTTGEEQELRLEYLLNRNVSLLGEQDERGSLGGDIKFRFSFE